MNKIKFITLNTVYLPVLIYFDKVSDKIFIDKIKASLTYVSIPTLVYESLNSQTLIVYGYIEISYKYLTFKDTIYYLLYKCTMNQLYNQLDKKINYMNFVLSKLYSLSREFSASEDIERIILETEANKLMQLSVDIDENCVFNLEKQLLGIKINLFGAQATSIETIYLKMKLLSICGAVEFFNNFYSQKHKLAEFLNGYQCTVFDNNGCFRNSFMLSYVKYFEIRNGHFIMPKDPLATIYPFLYELPMKKQIVQNQQQQEQNVQNQQQEQIVQNQHQQEQIVHSHQQKKIVQSHQQPPQQVNYNLPD